MRTELNLMSDRPATFLGRNTQYSGTGFADQHFAVRAATEAEFDAWIANAKGSANRLDAAGYAALAKPSRKVPVTYYSSFEAGLFDSIIEKYHGSPGHPEPDAVVSAQAPESR